MLYDNMCVFCDFLKKMALFANKIKTRNFQKVHPSFNCSPWSPLSKKTWVDSPSRDAHENLPRARAILVFIFIFTVCLFCILFWYTFFNFFFSHFIVSRFIFSFYLRCFSSFDHLFTFHFILLYHDLLIFIFINSFSYFTLEFLALSFFKGVCF